MSMRALWLVLLLAPSAFSLKPSLADARAVRRRSVLGGLAAAAMPALAPALALDDPAVDEALLARMQAARDAYKKESTRRGFAFEAGASMPYVGQPTTAGLRSPAPTFALRSSPAAAPAPEPAAPPPEPAAPPPTVLEAAPKSKARRK